MRHTIELSDRGAHALHELAKALATGSEEKALQMLTESILDDASIKTTPDGVDLIVRQGEESLIIQFKGGIAISGTRSTPNVMGGDVCIRNTRIPVWTLVDYKRQGLTDAQLLEAFPILNVVDLAGAWDYYASHGDEVDAQRNRHEDAA